ncbi:MAG: hypothetical protein KGM43_12225 [Planctomycetota bacterium]|nr:hypothetical protein [Planctomycetota bacterium]
MLISRAQGTTSQRIQIKITNASTGNGLTGLTATSSGLLCTYFRDGDTTATSVTLSAGTIGTWSSGGFVEISSSSMPGVYELGVPNACFATKDCSIQLSGAANMIDCPIKIEITNAGWNNQTVGFPPNLVDLAINTSGHVIEQHTLVYTATAASATSTTIVFPTGASTTTHAYEGCRVRIVSGTGSTPYQERVIKAYNGSTLTATIDRAWNTTPDATSVFEIVLDDNAGLDVNQNVNANIVDAAGSPAGTLTVGTIATACAAAILKTPANLLATDVSGYVTLTSAGLDQVIAEPAAGTQPAINARQALMLIVDAAAAGVVTELAPNVFAIQNPSGTLNRAVFTVDANNDRTSVSLTLP